MALYAQVIFWYERFAFTVGSSYRPPQKRVQGFADQLVGMPVLLAALIAVTLLFYTFFSM
ncbi:MULTISPECIES: hypothetical protein [unclassified Streptomyces]|uniref:hypothetical protein n=1 Tax=unclassified Streptomyces TaxID=2593676 RepID=UPI0038279442